MTSAERLRNDRVRKRSSFGRPPASPASGVIKASAPRLAISSRPCTTGSPKGSIPGSSRMPSRYCTSWRNAVLSLAQRDRSAIAVNRLLFLHANEVKSHLDDLVVDVERDKRLFNQYGVKLVNLPSTQVSKKLGQQFIDRLIWPECQNAIASYRPPTTLLLGRERPESLRVVLTLPLPLSADLPVQLLIQEANLVNSRI